MSDFKSIKTAIAAKFNSMKGMDLFVVDATKDELWDTYLGSFPEGSNPIFRERTEHDCNCCKQFIRDLGKVVAIDNNNNLISIWDITMDQFGPYQVVADAMLKLIHSKKIVGVFTHETKFVGTDFNMDTDTPTIRWDHFHAVLPTAVVMPGHKRMLVKSEMDGHKSVFQRSMEEITLDTANTVLELIANGSLYRGEEHKQTVINFAAAKGMYDAVPEELRNNYSWVMTKQLGQGGRFRNTVIGTLLADLSEGMDLDRAVASFESKVAPANYKRSKTLVTPRMIKDAEKWVTEMGLTDALPRRYAVADDLTINNVLFADRSVKPQLGAFAQLIDKATTAQNFSKIETVSVGRFMSDILPTADSIELLVENRHKRNLVSLIAPVNDEAPNILKWGNNFSWSYTGEVTDSIKERVAKAGGSVTGHLRCSLAWFNKDDLDIHVIEPGGNRICFRSKFNAFTGGRLDVDMNVSRSGASRDAVENITWSSKEKMQEGQYTVIVNNYNKRETVDVGFNTQIECDGVVHDFHYPQAVPDGGNVIVAKFNYTHADGIELLESLPHSQSSEEIWGINTGTFQPVEMIMHSPNHWDDQEVGNKHWFFMLKDCANPEPGRGLYNEFLRGDINTHRKVFEVLGAQLKTPVSVNQLSGMGFSSTVRNTVTCRVIGAVNRVIQIQF